MVTLGFFFPHNVVTWAHFFPPKKKSQYSFRTLHFSLPNCGNSSPGKQKPRVPIYLKRIICKITYLINNFLVFFPGPQHSKLLPSMPIFGFNYLHTKEDFPCSRDHSKQERECRLKHVLYKFLYRVPCLWLTYLSEVEL